MIFGQWWGEIKGDSNGKILVSVDKAMEDKQGALSIMPTDENTFPAIARIIFTSVDERMVKGNVDLFLGFTAREIVFPQDNERLRLSGYGEFAFNVIKDASGELSLKGAWKTNLNFKGSVELFKVRKPEAEPVKKIISWDDYKKIVSNPDKYKWGVTYFRGHPDSKHPLQTLFHRQQCWDLYRYYREIIPELFDHLGVLNNTRYPTTAGSDFGSPLLLAQHYGFPTPLLDWTLSPYVAAFFAFSEILKPSGTKSIRVFAFHTERWTKEQPGHTIGDLITPGITIKPLNIPLAGNKRAVAQSARSVFSSVENIENVLKFAEFQEKAEGMPEPYLDYFDINIGDKDKALYDLQSMNINELSMFPELHTACKVLRIKYF